MCIRDSFGIPSHPERFGESAFIFSHGERFLAPPEHGTFDAEHSWFRDCILHEPGTSRPALDSRGQPKLDPVAHNDRDKGTVCDHVNATVVGHAFYLMTFGGKNARSKVVVRNPIGWESSQALWLSMLVKVPTPQGFRALVPSTLLDLAQQQLAGARVYSVGVANAVGCAWEAVGVLDAGTTAKVTGAQCTLAGPIDCSLRPDGIYCDEVQPFSATRCQGGSTGASPAQCATGTVCRPRGGIITNQAETTSASVIVCYNPKGKL